MSKYIGMSINSKKRKPKEKKNWFGSCIHLPSYCVICVWCFLTADLFFYAMHCNKYGNFRHFFFLVYFLLLCFSLARTLSTSPFHWTNNNQCENLRTFIYARVRSFEIFIIYAFALHRNMMRWRVRRSDTMKYFIFMHESYSRWTREHGLKMKRCFYYYRRR